MIKTGSFAPFNFPVFISATTRNTVKRERRASKTHNSLAFFAIIVLTFLTPSFTDINTIQVPTAQFEDGCYLFGSLHRLLIGRIFYEYTTTHVSVRGTANTRVYRVRRNFRQRSTSPVITSVETIATLLIGNSTNR